MTVGVCACVCVCVWGGGGGAGNNEISPAKIYSLLCIEKTVILPVVLATSEFFFRDECVAYTTGDTCEC